LLTGELGLVASIKGLPWKIKVGDYLQVVGFSFPLRLAAASPPSRDTRQVLLAAPEAKMLERLYDIPRFPLQFSRLTNCSKENCHRASPPFQAENTSQESREVHVLAGAVAAGAKLTAKDTLPFRVAANLLPRGFVASNKIVTGSTAIQDLVPGEILLAENITDSQKVEDPVRLYVPGLYPDWLHPGGRAYFLRAHAEANPTPLEVLDMDRAPLGSPIPVDCRPLRGLTWPRVHRGKKPTHEHGESGHENWVLILKR
jgi:hypothetical protein